MTEEERNAALYARFDEHQTGLIQVTVWLSNVVATGVAALLIHTWWQWALFAGGLIFWGPFWAGQYKKALTRWWNAQPEISGGPDGGGGEPHPLPDNVTVLPVKARVISADIVA